jgi:hypothetical protein
MVMIKVHTTRNPQTKAIRVQYVIDHEALIDIELNDDGPDGITAHELAMAVLPELTSHAMRLKNMKDFERQSIVPRGDVL